MKNVRNPPPGTVIVPLDDLLKLQNSLAEVYQLCLEKKQLLKRIDGLHRTPLDLMSVVQDIRKEKPSRIA